MPTNSQSTSSFIASSDGMLPRSALDAATAPVARLEHVRFSYDDGATWALDDVSLEVYPGETLCLLGANGSGKSTLARLIAGLAAPDAGRVELMGHTCFDGTPHGDAYAHARTRTTCVFQNPSDQMVADVVQNNVAFGPENLCMPRERITQVVARELNQVAMAPYAYANPAELSGGQQQRVAFASALAMEPALLVLDEPGAQLDVRGRRGIRRVLGNLATSDHTALVHVTHFIKDALAASRIIVLQAGRIALEGTPTEVFSQPERLAALGLEEPLPLAVSRALHEAGVVLEPTIDAGQLIKTLVAYAPAAASATAATPAEKNLKEHGLEARRNRHSTPAAPASLSAPTAPQAKTAAPPAALLGPTNGTGSAGSAVSAGPTTSHLCLEGRDLSFTYGDKKHLRQALKTGCNLELNHVNVHVAAGECLCLVGHTGSGKSTLMRLLAGLATPLTGELTLAGNPVRTKRDRRHMCRSVGYAAQRCEQQLFCDTVEEDVAYGPANLGYRGAELSARVQATLELLGIAPLAQADPFALSGGQQRLVALAGVLAMRPQLLLLDEPLAGLDAWHRTHVKTLLKRLQSQGMGIIIITHEMEDAAQLANRIQVLSHGQTVLEGTPYQVFSQQAELRRLGLGVPPTLQFARDLAAAGAPLLETPQNPCLTQEDLLAAVLATYAPHAAAPLAEKRREAAATTAGAVPAGATPGTTPATAPGTFPATSGTAEVNA